MNPSKELVCKENGKIFRLYTNGIKFDKIKLDDGQNNECKKCDYLITKQTKDIQIFVELKGSDVMRAYEQILASYENNKAAQCKCYAAIITSKIPQMDSTVQRLKRKAHKIFKEVFIKNNKLETRYNLVKNEIEKSN